MSSATQTMRGWATQEVVADRRAQALIGVIAFALATAFGAQVAVRLPWTPVPVTLQPLFVILAGAVIGPRLGATAIAIYLGAGAMGAPVFSNGAAGFPWLLGPTGGYLLAMPAAAFVSGWCVGRDGGLLRTTAGLVAGILTIYAGGVSQLALLTGEGFSTLMALGVVPFLVGDATKVALGVVLTRLLRPTSFGRL